MSKQLAICYAPDSDFIARDALLGIADFYQIPLRFSYSESDPLPNDNALIDGTVVLLSQALLARHDYHELMQYLQASKAPILYLQVHTQEVLSLPSSIVATLWETQHLRQKLVDLAAA
jgi:hypothetical protein